MGTSRRVDFTPCARDAIAQIRDRDGVQAIVLSWPVGATYLPYRYYLPGKFDVVLTHVAGCPVFADVRRLSLFSIRRVLVDAELAASPHVRPRLRVRPTGPDGTGPLEPHEDGVRCALCTPGTRHVSA